MIWYFLAGFIAGVVGVYMFAGWYCKRHKEKIERRDRMVIAYMEDLRVNHPEFWKVINTVPGSALKNDGDEEKNDGKS